MHRDLPGAAGTLRSRLAGTRDSLQTPDDVPRGCPEPEQILRSKTALGQQPAAAAARKGAVAWAHDRTNQATRGQQFSLAFLFLEPSMGAPRVRLLRHALVWRMPCSANQAPRPRRSWEAACSFLFSLFCRALIQPPAIAMRVQGTARLQPHRPPSASPWRWLSAGVYP
jgi:hypothetical protein